MPRHHRSRPLLAAALTAATLFGFVACTTNTPNTTLDPTTEFGRVIDAILRQQIFWGVIVFVLVEAMLIWVMIRYRARPGRPEPKHVHGNTTLEIAWTLAPAVILAILAVPTVKAIFRTQGEAVAGALQVEVIGHQWWWEFRYPQYGIVTANELYLPVGRTVDFSLQSVDVLHAFWVPMLGGKRDLITNRTNHIWFTPESTYVWNGVCVEYCGSSHANMRFKTFTVLPDEFERWAAHQKTGPAFGGGAAATGGTPATAVAGGVDTVARTGEPAPTAPAQTPLAYLQRPVRGAPMLAADVPAFPPDRLPLHIASYNPVPRDLTLENVTGDAARGAELYKRAPCIGCHVIQGVSGGITGPNLTHIGSRVSIGAGLYPNDARHLALWLKNSPRMKPGSKMPALGKSAQLPAGFDDQQIADLAAYLLSLK